ncbi:hypothetical protein FJU08_13940 [Martelella alba]|uniref:Surface antigen n=1 Tax=Martelella alba TaxID=2590451 RepID=A0A506U8K9_9HYPH|nr:lipoprotein [Martelella alba]TPW29434.1 hypothetical protein FJU08_13940 [Martelella alba]
MKQSICAFFLLLGLAGCSTVPAPNVSIPHITVGSSQKAGSGSVTLDDALLRRSGVSLSGADSKKAIEAEYYALDSAPAGEDVPWQGNQASGSVSAASPYRVGDEECRQYTHKINANGTQFVARGAACRSDAGSWVALD